MNRKNIFILLVLLVMTSFGFCRHTPRLIILADMGNEPDEEQQMMHMLMYCNEFDLQGLIAVSGKFLHDKRTKADKNRVQPQLFNNLIDAYAKVHPNLTLHESDWPAPAYLKSIVKAGSSTYGMNAVGDGKSSPGSNLILNCIKKNLTDGSIYICVNAGSNTLAQALWDLRADKTISQTQKDTIYSRIFVFENGAQDNAGAWIAGQFPLIVWNRSNCQTYAYGGEGKNPIPGPYVWSPYPRTSQGQHAWAKEHIMNNHGPLGARFPYRFKGHAFIEGGGTVPWIGLIDKGLFDYEHMWWGGFSGRCSRTKHQNVPSRHDNIVNGTAGPEGYPLTPAEKTYRPYSMYEADSETETWTDPVLNETFKNNLMVPVWRFRRAMWNDFQARMDWCVKPYEQANHNPIAAFNGDTSDTIIRMKAKPGQILSLDATTSQDPDGDAFDVRWWIYREAGTYKGNVTIQNSQKLKTSMVVPTAAAGKQIHVILEIQDKNPIVSLYDYRRIVIDVDQK